MAGVNEIAALQQAIDALQSQIDALQSQIDALRSQIDAERHELAVVKGTFSWRVTAPLRRVRNAQRAIARRAR
jgi:peptidoglycan hydrolase CwlO-like protein